MCQLAWEFISDRYDRSQTTASIIVERVTTQPRLSLLSAVYNSACILPGARGGRDVRAVGVATLNANFRKKAKDKRKNWAVQRQRTGNI